MSTAILAFVIHVHNKQTFYCINPQKLCCLTEEMPKIQQQQPTDYALFIVYSCYAAFDFFAFEGQKAMYEPHRLYSVANLHIMKYTLYTGKGDLLKKS